jgi:hypothetical protein
MSTLPEIFLFLLSSFSFVRNGRGERGKRKEERERFPEELASLPVAPAIGGFEDKLLADATALLNKVNPPPFFFPP